MLRVDYAGSSFVLSTPLGEWAHRFTARRGERCFCTHRSSRLTLVLMEASAVQCRTAGFLRNTSSRLGFPSFHRSRSSYHGPYLCSGRRLDSASGAFRHTGRQVRPSVCDGDHGEADMPYGCLTLLWHDSGSLEEHGRHGVPLRRHAARLSTQWRPQQAARSVRTNAILMVFAVLLLVSCEHGTGFSGSPGDLWIRNHSSETITGVIVFGRSSRGGKPGSGGATYVIMAVDLDLGIGETEKIHIPTTYDSIYIRAERLAWSVREVGADRTITLLDEDALTVKFSVVNESSEVVTALWVGRLSSPPLGTRELAVGDSVVMAFSRHSFALPFFAASSSRIWSLPGDTVLQDRIWVLRDVDSHYRLPLVLTNMSSDEIRHIYIHVCASSGDFYTVFRTIRGSSVRYGESFAFEPVSLPFHEIAIEGDRLKWTFAADEVSTELPILVTDENSQSLSATGIDSR